MSSVADPRYIFANMFTAVVVEAFAYVYQMPGQASLTREDMRRSCIGPADPQARSRPCGPNLTLNDSATYEDKMWSHFLL